MKKLLPISHSFDVNKKGFTLIELMVVIAIIAILSVIGYGIFNGAQGGARDARRRIEIDQLSKNIESVRNPSTGDYLYDGTMGNADYPSGLNDPLSTNFYCYGVNTTSTPPADPTNAQVTAQCAGTTPVKIGGAAGSFSVNVIAGVTNDLADTGIKGWKLCAASERGSTPICKSNTLR